MAALAAETHAGVPADSDEVAAEGATGTEVLSARGPRIAPIHALQGEGEVFKSTNE